MRKDIHEWLEECLSYSEIEYAVSVREVMRQFMKTIERFTNQMKEDKKVELAELIMKSPENFRAAIELREALKFAVEDMRKKFLEAVCEGLKHMALSLKNLIMLLKNAIMLCSIITTSCRILLCVLVAARLIHGFHIFLSAGTKQNPLSFAQD